MEVTFNQALRTDIPEIVDMMQTFYAIDQYPIDADHTVKMMEDFLEEDKRGGLWLIASGKTVCGYLVLTDIFSFEYGGWIGFVDELFVKDSFRGKGIGKKAIGFIQSEAQKRNLKILYLEVEPHNKTAQGLYLNQGFKQHKRQLLIWKNEELTMNT